MISGVTRSAALTVYSTIGFADMPADQMRDASTLRATTSQLAVGLSAAFATVVLRIGGLLPGAAFGVLAVISLAAAAEAVRLRPEAGDAARAARPPARAAPASERN